MSFENISNRFIARRLPESIWLVEYEPWREKGIEHGFLGRAGCGEEQESVSIERALGRAVEVFSVKQVHGREVCSVEHNSRADCERGSFDGLIAQIAPESNRCLIVRSADCVPLLLKWGGFVSAIHAGWRGLAGGIVEQGLDALLETGLDLRGAELEALIGPCARSCCYEVGPEVPQRLGSTACVQSTERLTLCMASSAARRLEQALRERGIVDFAIADSGVCTICTEEFCSYRRSGESPERNLSFVSC